MAPNGSVENKHAAVQFQPLDNENTAREFGVRRLGAALSFGSLLPPVE
jgi:hypothetical protein